MRKKVEKKIKQKLIPGPAIEEMSGKEKREDGNNAERDDGRGVNRESFGAEEAPSARTRAAGRSEEKAAAGNER